MRTSQRILTRAAVALAVTGAFAPAYAQEPDVAALTRPDSTARVGVGFTPGNEHDRTIWSQYNGMREGGTHLLLDLDYVKRDEQTGFWTVFRGRNLGLNSRDAAFTLNKQGDWRFTADYSELVHNEIRTLNTGMLGPGTTAPQIVRLPAPGAGVDTDFSLKRSAFGLSGDKWFTSNLQLEVAFRDENKNGTRFWGRGYDCNQFVCSSTQSATNQRWAVLPVGEPVDFNTKAIEAKLNFTSAKLFTTVGYYGSFFSNANGNVAPVVPNALNGAAVGAPFQPAVTLSPAAAGGTSLQGVLQLPMALYPDNQAHQFYVSGNYAWTKNVRSTFKLARTHSTQDENFGSMGFTGAPAVTRTSLGGLVDTTLAQGGVTARMTDKLSLLANVRYERRSDQTPIAQYNVEPVSAGVNNRWNNYHLSAEKFNSRFEASYRLPADIRATAGIDYDAFKKELPGLDVEIGGLTGLRGQTHEVTYRGELRRSISETLTGSVGIAHSDRTGGKWYSLSTVPAQNLVYGGQYSYNEIFQRTGTFPFDMADRKRDKVKFTADWTPIERLSLQGFAEAGRDSYDPPSQNGLRYGGMTLLSGDASYAITERWRLTAFASIGDQTMGENDRANYVADIKNRNRTYGIGVAGRLSGGMDVGASMARNSDSTTYALSPDQATSANNIAQTNVGLPPVYFSDTRYNVYARYAVNKQSDIRLDVTRVLTRLEEWAWGYGGVPFTFQDNTTISLNQHQHVTFVGASYIYKF